MFGMSLALDAGFKCNKVIKELRRFHASVGTYAQFPAWNPVDFRIRLLFVAPATSGWETLIGNDTWDSNAGWLIYMSAGANTLVFRNAGGVELPSQSLTPGTLYEAVIERTGDDHSITIAGQTSSANFAAGHSAAPELYIGCRHTNDGTGRTDYFDERILLAELTDLSDPQNSVRYGRFCQADRIVPNALASLGENLFDGAGVFYGASGTVESNNLTLSAAVSYGRYEVVPSTPIAGSAFLFEFTVDDPTGKTVINAYGAGNTLDVALAGKRFGSGQHQVIVHVDSLEKYQIRHELTGIEVVISDISIRKAPGYGQLHNPADGSVSRYIRKGDVLLGPELLGTSWSIQGTVVDNADGTFTADGTQGGSINIYQPNTLEEGAQYRMSLAVLDISAGGMKMFAHGAATALIAAAGVVSADLVATGSNATFWCDPAFAGTLKPLSTRRVIPLAPGVTL